MQRLDDDLHHEILKVSKWTIPQSMLKGYFGVLDHPSGKWTNDMLYKYVYVLALVMNWWLFTCDGI